MAPAGLFPEQGTTPRAHKFQGKKVVFLSARVHPGETCSSFVMLGILKFLTNDKDPRAAALRRKYVFQLLPMLNPDGVFNGHYRTDTRGVNLNRVYSEPSPVLHPTIHAARQLVLLAHLGEEVQEPGKEPLLPPEPLLPLPAEDSPCTADTFCDWYKPQSVWQQGGRGASTRGGQRSSTSSRVSNSSRASSTLSSHLPAISPSKPVPRDLSLHWYEMTDTSRCSEGDESVADFSLPLPSTRPVPHHLEEATTFLPPSSRPGPEARTTFAGAFPRPPITPTKLPAPVGPEEEQTQQLSQLEQEDIPLFKPKGGESNVFLYVDIHGHASKRGIFMYGNHFDDLETKISALLFPKLMAVNSANFDFPACNFTQRNMFMKDRHTGAGREGSGRVSVYRATGLTYCYTLECNFNSGRHTNTVPPASRDCGRASPPPIHDTPPRYCPEVYEQCGKYLVISILDLTESNPWTRLPCSPCTTLKGVRQWIKQYIKSAEAETAAKTARASKGSPMRTRLRSLSSGPRKSPLKTVRAMQGPQDPTQGTVLPKLARKMLSPRGGKLGRQNSRSKSAKSATEDVAKVAKKKRSSSSAKKASSTGSVSRPKTPGSRAGSRSGSRASSPRCGAKLEPKVTKLGLQKKALAKAAWRAGEDALGGLANTSVVEPGSVKKTKRKKKRVAPMSTT